MVIILPEISFNFHWFWVRFVEFYYQIWLVDPKSIISNVVPLLCKYWPIWVDFGSENEVPTQIHYFYFCPTFGLENSWFSLNFHWILTSHDQIHYFYFCPTFHQFCQDLEQIWAIIFKLLELDFRLNFIWLSYLNPEFISVWWIWWYYRLIKVIGHELLIYLNFNQFDEMMLKEFDQHQIGFQIDLAWIGFKFNQRMLLFESIMANIWP